jgi:thiamine biosynthesis protein ThiS
MRIKINGESSEYSGPPTLCELLRSLDIDFNKVAVERNLVIVPRSRIEDEAIEPGDEFEIIRLVGGG